MIRSLAAGAVAAAIASASMAQAGEPVGVAACDDFLAKYQTCLSAKVPAAQQASFQSQIDQTRKTWIGLAKNPSTKASLDFACKQTSEQMKPAFQSYGCVF